MLRKIGSLTLLSLALGFSATSFAEPKTVSVSAAQESQLSQLGQTNGLDGFLAYKRVSTQATEYPTVTEAMPLDAGQLVSSGVLNLGVVIGANDYTIDMSQRLSKGFELPLSGPNLPAKVSHNILLKGRYLMYVKRPLAEAVSAFVPMEDGATVNGWLGSEKNIDVTSGDVRMIRYTLLKDGHYKNLCTDSATVVPWTVDHVEMQVVESDCREVSASDLESAKAEVEKAAASGKPKFIWLNQGRQSIDFIRITGDITAIYVRNLGQVYTHKAMLGIDVGLDKVLPAAEEAFKDFMIASLNRMGIKKVKPSDLHYGN